MLRLIPQIRGEAGTVKKATMIVVAFVLWSGMSVASEKGPATELPKILTLGTLSKIYEPVRFDHAAHVSYAGGCADCHHQHIGLQVSPCLECHQADSAAFRKNVKTGKLRPCSECHPPSIQPKGTSHVELKAAYHEACMKCHKSDVGSGVKSLKDCAGMCHALKEKAKAEEKK
jgi:hypothetical protein